MKWVGFDSLPVKGHSYVGRNFVVSCHLPLALAPYALRWSGWLWRDIDWNREVPGGIPYGMLGMS
jgi:hypothetical protein